MSLKFNSKVGRYGSFRAGLTRQVIDRGFTRYAVHHINVGGNYGRPLSSSKRAYYTIGGGSATLQSNSDFRMFAVADAGLTYDETGNVLTVTAGSVRGADANAAALLDEVPSSTNPTTHPDVRIPTDGPPGRG